MPGQTRVASVRKMKRMRTSVTSRLKYSASPAQTPAIFLSARERVSFFGVGRIPCTVPQREQKRPSSAMGLPQALQNIVCLPFLLDTGFAGKCSAIRKPAPKGGLEDGAGDMPEGIS